jgi:hypothetical protein
MASMESENKKTNQFFKKNNIKLKPIPLILYHGPTLNF